jgi:hypothetical protein
MLALHLPLLLESLLCAAARPAAQVIIPAEADTWVRPEDVPANIDHNFAIMEINKQQVKALAAAEAQRRAEAEAARAQAQEQVCGLGPTHKRGDWGTPPRSQVLRSHSQRALPAARPPPPPGHQMTSCPLYLHLDLHTLRHTRTLLGAGAGAEDGAGEGGSGQGGRGPPAVLRGEGERAAGHAGYRPSKVRAWGAPTRVLRGGVSLCPHPRLACPSTPPPLTLGAVVLSPSPPPPPPPMLPAYRVPVLPFSPPPPN